MNKMNFPLAWQWFMDEAVPSWVKNQYSRHESWKTKPFSQEDARFFFKGVEDLSELYTEERPKGMPPYFQHPKFRSGYLLYFLPLQAAKYLTLFNMYTKAIEAALDHARKVGSLKLADLGAGPGTASLSLLLYLADPKWGGEKELPPIELEWFDINPEIMNDGKGLVEILSSHFPRLRGKVKVTTRVTPWWNALPSSDSDYSLVIFGNVLNEASSMRNNLGPFWNQWIQKAHGGGLLMVEPASKKPSQLLSSLRDQFFEWELLERQSTRLWGPCLHAGHCPLAQGRDWCHASIPTSVPGKWFKTFSEALSSERLWLKFSYLWIASSTYPSPQPDSRMKRVISDPLKKPGSRDGKPMVLICEPETPGRIFTHRVNPPQRGDLIQASGGGAKLGGAKIGGTKLGGPRPWDSKPSRIQPRAEPRRPQPKRGKPDPTRPSSSKRSGPFRKKR